MSQKVLFEGQAVRSEMILLMLEKWGLHPVMKEAADQPNLDDLDRDTSVFIGEEEFDRAREILWGESEIERAGF